MSSIQYLNILYPSGRKTIPYNIPERGRTSVAKAPSTSKICPMLGVSKYVSKVYKEAKKKFK